MAVSVKVTVKVTDRDRLTQLQRATNASTEFPHGGAINGCPLRNNGKSAEVLVVYPGATPIRTITYNPSCGLLGSGANGYLAAGGFIQLIEDWTGPWQPLASLKALSAWPRPFRDIPG